MNLIEINETFDCKNHTILVTNKHPLTSKKYDKELTPLIIKQKMKEFNTLSNNLIIDYDYEIIDRSSTLNIEIVFKHIFNKLDEEQRFFRGTCSLNDNSIEIIRNDNIKLSCKIPSNAKDIYINYIKITNEVKNDNSLTVVNFVTDDDVKNYKNFELLFVFIKKILNKVYCSNIIKTA